MDSSLQWINLNSWVVDPFTANTEEFNPKLQLSKAEIIIVGCFKLSYVVWETVTGINWPWNLINLLNQALSFASVYEQGHPLGKEWESLACQIALLSFT